MLVFLHVLFLLPLQDVLVLLPYRADGVLDALLLLLWLVGGREGGREYGREKWESTTLNERHDETRYAQMMRTATRALQKSRIYQRNHHRFHQTYDIQSKQARTAMSLSYFCFSFLFLPRKFHPDNQYPAKMPPNTAMYVARL